MLGVHSTSVLGERSFLNEHARFAVSLSVQVGIELTARFALHMYSEVNRSSRPRTFRIYLPRLDFLSVWQWAYGAVSA